MNRDGIWQAVVAGRVSWHVHGCVSFKGFSYFLAFPQLFNFDMQKFDFREIIREFGGLRFLAGSAYAVAFGYLLVYKSEAVESNPLLV